LSYVVGALRGDGLARVLATRSVRRRGILGVGRLDLGWMGSKSRSEARSQSGECSGCVTTLYTAPLPKPPPPTSRPVTDTVPSPRGRNDLSVSIVRALGAATRTSEYPAST
jgi:hypothetical protein